MRTILKWTAAPLAFAVVGLLWIVCVTAITTRRLLRGV